MDMFENRALLLIASFFLILKLALLVLNKPDRNQGPYNTKPLYLFFKH